EHAFPLLEGVAAGPGQEPFRIQHENGMAKEKLTEYSAKRSFQATPEPAPAAGEAREGPLLFVIPPGQYGAGEVIVWDCGVYSPDEGGHWFHDRAEAERQVRAGLGKGKLSILLRGEKVKGSYALVRTKEQKNWLLIKHKDRFAAKADL